MSNVLLNMLAMNFLVFLGQHMVLTIIILIIERMIILNRLEAVVMNSLQVLLAEFLQLLFIFLLLLWILLILFGFLLLVLFGRELFLFDRLILNRRKVHILLVQLDLGGWWRSLQLWKWLNGLGLDGLCKFFFIWQEIFGIYLLLGGRLGLRLWLRSWWLFSFFDLLIGFTSLWVRLRHRFLIRNLLGWLNLLDLLIRCHRC